MLVELCLLQRCGIAGLRRAAVALVPMLLGSALTFFSPAASASTATLAWDVSPSADVGGYNVYYGTTSGGPYPNSDDAGNLLTHTVTGLTAGQV